MELLESEFPALWEILRATDDPNNNILLTCDECFAVMEYLADCAMGGATRETIFAAAQKHLARCPDCRVEFAARIQALEKLSKSNEE